MFDSGSILIKQALSSLAQKFLSSRLLILNKFRSRNPTNEAISGRGFFNISTDRAEVMRKTSSVWSRFSKGILEKFGRSSLRLLFGKGKGPPELGSFYSQPLRILGKGRVPPVRTPPQPLRR